MKLVLKCGKCRFYWTPDDADNQKEVESPVQ